MRLSKLQIDGAGKTPAVVDFKSGLNTVVGASDTGKSYIFHSINYLLGSSTQPRDNPHSSGYTRGWLQLALGDGKVLTIERVFGEDDVNLYDVEVGKVSALDGRRIKASHVTGSTESLSYYLLQQIGLAGRQVKRNQEGGKTAVTFRHLAHATMIDEERIITTGSPAMTGQYISETSDKGVFGVLLTGNDDSALTAPKVDKKTRNASLDGEIGVLQRMIADRQSRLDKLSQKPDELDSQLEKVTAAVEQGAAVVSATRERIVTLEAERRQLWEEFQRNADRRLLLGEQLKRFRVLFDYYDSDTQRLSAVLEAGTAFSQLPSGECAACGKVNSESDAAAINKTLQAFQSACVAELTKMESLRRDLQQAIGDTETEHKELAVRSSELEGARRSIDSKLQTELTPYRESVDVSLNELIRVKSDLSRAKDISDELRVLRNDLATAEAARAVKTPAAKGGVRVDTRVAQEFCQVVSDTLRAWKYPLNGTVAFDPTKFDLVIGNQDRGSMGKGFRAITHAAFAIGLMRYCRKKGLPHTGYVIIDSPLNPFKGASMSSGPDAVVNEEIKESFYRDLAADISGDQYVIFENTEPPADLLSQINYVQFTRNSSVGRYGFFPMA